MLPRTSGKQPTFPVLGNEIFTVFSYGDCNILLQLDGNRALRLSGKGLLLVTVPGLCYNFYGNHGDRTVVKEWGNPLFIFGI